MTTLGIALETLNLAPSQYAGLNFDSLCVFNGVVLGFGEVGIMELTGDDDNGTDIDAFFQIASTDLGVKQQKKVRSLTVNGYNKGDLIITVIVDNDEATEYTVLPSGALDQSGFVVDLNSDDIGRYVGLLVENVNGADFSIDAMDLLVIPTVKEPTTRTIVGRHRETFPLFTLSAEMTVVDI